MLIFGIGLIGLLVQVTGGETSSKPSPPALSPKGRGINGASPARIYTVTSSVCRHRDDWRELLSIRGVAGSDASPDPAPFVTFHACKLTDLP